MFHRVKFISNKSFKAPKEQIEAPQMTSPQPSTANTTQIIPIAHNPYLFKKYHSSVSYLLKKYGVESKVKTVELTFKEKEIENTISALMELIEPHYQFWSTTKSVVTKESLAFSKNVLASLLTALHTVNPKEKVVKLCLALHNVDLSLLIKAFRTPWNKDDKKETEEFRAKVLADRQTFKAGIIQVMNGFKSIVDENDDALIQDLVQSPHAKIKEFFNGMKVKAEEVDVNANLEEQLTFI
jgi:hypothetical protein